MVEKIAGWPHSGFSVHSKVKASTSEEAERVGKQVIRPLLSLERLSFSEPQGKVSCRYGKQAEELKVVDYLEFIARVTSHIPDKHQVMVRYFGLCQCSSGKATQVRGGGGTMKVAFITDYSVVDRIINHLKLTFVPAKPPPPHITYQALQMAAETSTEYVS